MVATVVDFWDAEDELFGVQGNAVLTGAEQSVTNLGEMSRQFGIVHKTIVIRFNKVGETIKRRICARVKHIPSRYKALRVAKELVPPPRCNNVVKGLASSDSGTCQ